MEEIELLDIADDLLVINKATIERLFQEDNTDVLALYMFYYKTAKWQKHNPIKASDDYCQRCLHWGLKRVKNIKKRLKELELITVEMRKNGKQQIDGWYIKINYYINSENSSGSISSGSISPLVAKKDHKILLNNNINTNNNKNIYYSDKELNDLFLEFLEVRKKKKAVNSDRAIKMLINKLSNYSDDIKYKMIEKSIVNSWKDVYELKEQDTPGWFYKDLDKEDEIRKDDLTDEQRERIERLIRMD